MATETPPAAGPISGPFPSLAALRECHAELLRTIPEGETDRHEGRILDFLKWGAATGAVLDQPQDRDTAQGLLDYWKATLYTQQRRGQARRASGQGADASVRLPPVILKDFDPETITRILGDAERWFAG